MINLPLTGITVVSCEQAVAAPFATRQLADLGARVIKIERPGTGDFARAYDETVLGQSSHFVWLNRSKESVALDLKDPAAIEDMHALIETADVFVQNLAPGAAERLGLGPAALRELNPRLITCSISGYGSSGPYRDAKAYDLLIQSEVGLVSVTGSEETPAKSGIPAADIGAGMYAFSGILSALYDRERTGEGTDLEISLFDSLVEWMGYPLYYSEYGGTPPARTGTSHAAIAPYGSFTVGDDREVVLSVQNQREWESFCRCVLRQPELTADSRFETGAARVANRTQLHDEIDAVFSTLTVEELETRLEEGKIAHARQRTLSEVADHPQLTARQRLTTVESPAGPITAILPVISFPGRTPRMDPIPAVGEHTDAVLNELREPEGVDGRIVRTPGRAELCTGYAPDGNQLINTNVDGVTAFRLNDTPILSRSALGRAEESRSDTDALRAGWRDALLLRVNHRGQVQVGGDRLLFADATELGPEPQRGAVFLGIRKNRHVWAVREQTLTGELADLRILGGILDDADAGVLTGALAMLNWHDSAGFSALDGAPSEPTMSGWSRISPSTGHEEFARTDPAVICLVHDGGDRVLLARQHTWPARRFSILAGFVEAGESLETCVIREIREEVGVDVRDVRYLGSQPWPFPRSVMIGFAAIGDPDAPLTFADGEIAEARWFTRDEVRTALELGDWASDTDAPLLLPGSISIARGIVESWVGAATGEGLGGVHSPDTVSKGSIS